MTARRVSAWGARVARAARAFEFRHVPDPVQVETVLLPVVERLRVAKTRAESLEAR